MDELEKARADEDDHASRNLIYSRAATRTGVSYDRVVDLCHDRLYVLSETDPDVHRQDVEVWFNGWKMGMI